MEAQHSASALERTRRPSSPAAAAAVAGLVDKIRPGSRVRLASPPTGGTMACLLTRPPARPLPRPSASVVGLVLVCHACRNPLLCLTRASVTAHTSPFPLRRRASFRCARCVAGVPLLPRRVPRTARAESEGQAVMHDSAASSHPFTARAYCMPAASTRGRPDRRQHPTRALPATVRACRPRCIHVHTHTHIHTYIHSQVYTEASVVRWQHGRRYCNLHGR